ncbi:CRISPR-associated endonuclease Cas2 [Acidithiobacillus caldus]|jgi:CRISPR-associated protein Cas2|uniref:CRISPR-associated endonuclease Cas2 n=1 Tax=Acidithiobacillus caldus TaxID=33059 RepID=UPI0009837844|nr:CRISPR-associated endonuclease Cas2 [Acidithiobacillus caldus]
MSRLWMICYDINDSRRRRAIEQELQRYGDRVQKSVFECLLNPEQLRALRTNLLLFLDQEHDSIRYYPLCKRCQDKVCWQGIGNRPDTAEWHIM